MKLMDQILMQILTNQTTTMSVLATVRQDATERRGIDLMITKSMELIRRLGEAEELNKLDDVQDVGPQVQQIQAQLIKEMLFVCEAWLKLDAFTKNPNDAFAKDAGAYQMAYEMALSLTEGVVNKVKKGVGL